MNKQLSNILLLIEQSALPDEEKQKLLKEISGADKQWNSLEFKLDQIEKVEKSTAVLLAETIDELTQKRKAVEAQNRELEIQAALERVRAVAMSMTEPADMLNVCRIISEQLTLLGVNEIRNVQTAVFYEGKGTYMNYEYYAKHGKAFITETTYTNNEIHQAFAVQMLKGSGEFFHTHIQGGEVKDWIAYQKTTNVFIDSFLETASSLDYYWHSLGQVALGISTYVPLTEDEMALFNRFLKVFELAYRRHLDIEQAKAQTREAQIQLALERVRARTIAMHESSELLETADLLFDQVKQLGADLQGVAFAICDKDSVTVQKWTSIGVFSHPYTIDAGEQRMYEAWKNGEAFYEEVYEGERQRKYYEAFMEIPSFRQGLQKFIDSGQPIPTWQKNHSVIFKYGYLLFITTKPFAETEIFLRFGKVFEQTYTRFLDLQQAEKQARDAQIETALERVRSRTMAMQKSDELRDVIKVVLEQFVQLNINVEHAGFYIDYKAQDDMHIWLADPNIEPFFAIIPYFDTPTWNSFLDAKAKGTVLHTDLLSFEEKNKFYQSLFNLFTVPEEAKEFYLQCKGLAVSTVLLETVGLYIENFSAIPYTDEENAILMRFGNVFQQTYTRFLDLQKAEAQGRETQIQLCLERARARALAMQHSDELNDVLTVLFNQFDELGIKPISCYLTLVDTENRCYTIRSTGKQGKRGSASQTVSADASDIWKELVERWLNGNPLTVFCNHIPNEVLPQVFELYGQIAEGIPEDVRPTLADYPDGAFTTEAYCKYGYVGFTHTRPATEEEKNILIRFAGEFGGLYTRFLDLQRAEEQAREAEIQLALERVRAKTMAMQKQEDLLGVLSLLVEQLVKLGLHVDIASFSDGIPEGDWNVWLYQPINEGISTADYLHIPQIDHPYFTKVQEGAKSFRAGVSDFFKDSFSKAEKDSWLDYFLPKVFKKEVPEELKKYLYDQPGFLWSVKYFQDTWVAVCKYSTEPYRDEDDNLLKRFADAFGLAYTRFLDLQRAESAAREAVKQASLDRVRAEIASMRTTKDLERITPLVWNELTMLTIPFIRCGVFILNEEQQQAHVYLSSPEGKAIAALHLPFADNSQFVQSVVHYWRKNQLFTDHWDAEAFAAWTHSLLQAGMIRSEEQYSTDSPPENLYLHFLPFTQGMLYVGNTAPLSTAELDIVQSLANAFATAYARYEDFRKLEAAKQQIETTLSELRATQQQLVQQEKMASLGELTAGIAHEIQNPLNFVNNFSEASLELLEELRSELAIAGTADAVNISQDIEQNLQKIHHHGKRADSIVKSMLQHSRKSSGQKELTDINTLTEEYLRLSYHGQRAKDKLFTAIIETHFDPAVGKVPVAAQDISRVLLNLFNNAFYAVSEKKKTAMGVYEPLIQVATRRLSDAIEIRVKDNGIGMPEKIKEKIYQPFFTTKPTGEGTGLGLSLSYDIITKGHGGTLTVQSTEGKGSEFVIILPLN